MGRQVNRERKQQDQKYQKPECGNSGLRFFTKAVDPVDILARVAEEIREWQYNDRDNRLRDEGALVVAEPVQQPNEQRRRPTWNSDRLRANRGMRRSNM